LGHRRKAEILHGPTNDKLCHHTPRIQTNDCNGGRYAHSFFSAREQCLKLALLDINFNDCAYSDVCKLWSGGHSPEHGAKLNKHD
jgi:hypothetical protein